MPDESVRLVNFGHPITERQQRHIAAALGGVTPEIVDVDVFFDADQSIVGQAVELVDRAGVTPQRWQQGRIIVNLPGHSGLASVLLAEIHGRSGMFPTIVRLRRRAVVNDWELAELIDLQALRERGRIRRSDIR